MKKLITILLTLTMVFGAFAFTEEEQYYYDTANKIASSYYDEYTKFVDNCIKSGEFSSYEELYKYEAEYYKQLANAAKAEAYDLVYSELVEEIDSFMSVMEELNKIENKEFDSYYFRRYDIMLCYDRTYTIEQAFEDAKESALHDAKSMSREIIILETLLSDYLYLLED